MALCAVIGGTIVAQLSPAGSLNKGPMNQDMTSLTGRYRHDGIDHRGKLTWPLRTAAIPVQSKSQRLLDVGDTQRGARIDRMFAGPVGDTVNIRRGQPGIRIASRQESSARSNPVRSSLRPTAD